MHIRPNSNGYPRYLSSSAAAEAVMQQHLFPILCRNNCAPHLAGRRRVAGWRRRVAGRGRRVRVLRQQRKGFNAKVWRSACGGVASSVAAGRGRRGEGRRLLCLHSKAPTRGGFPIP